MQRSSFVKGSFSITIFFCFTNRHGPIDAANLSHDFSNRSNDDQTGIEAQPIGESNSIALSHSIEKATLK